MIYHNNVWLTLLNMSTFLWLGCWTAFVVMLALRGYRPSIIGPMLVIFAFNGMPLLLDEVVGRPTYPRQPGFAIATQDFHVSFIYCFYMFLVPPLLWQLGRTQHQKNILKSLLITQGAGAQHSEAPRWVLLVLHMLVVLPIFFVLNSPSPSTYLQFGWKESWRWGPHNLTPEVMAFAPWLARIALVSIIAAAALVVVKKRLSIPFMLFLALMLYLDVVVVSMRHAFVYVCVLGIFTLWYRGNLSGVKPLIVSGLALLALGVFSTVFLRDYRLLNVSAVEEYRQFRIDYGRDDVVKMTLYAEMYPDRMRILEYRGQSLVYDLLIFIPRSIWPEKPHEYSYYFTSAMLLIEPERFPYNRGYMTNSWLEEAIANFSWFGLLVGPLVPALVCRVGDARTRTGLASVPTFLTACLLLAVHLPAFYPIFVLWLVVTVLKL